MTINEIKFFNFDLVSKRTGHRFTLTMFGRNEEDARERLIEGNLQNQNWNRWALEAMGEKAEIGRGM
jgi:hypothetical protein